jgi:hypothetical protein
MRLAASRPSSKAAALLDIAATAIGLEAYGLSGDLDGVHAALRKYLDNAEQSPRSRGLRRQDMAVRGKKGRVRIDMQEGQSAIAADSTGMFPGTPPPLR